jgi:hypothetical protein
VGIPLFVDWSLLAAQCAVLLFFIVRGAAKQRDRNLYALLVPLTLLLLVQGQAWWVLARLQYASYLVQLNHVITRDGARLANLYLSAAMLFFLLGYTIASRVQPGSAAAPLKLAAQRHTPRTVVAVLTALGAAGVFALAGGAQGALENPGRAIAGQTFLLVIVGIGKMPALADLSAGKRPSKYSVALIVVTFAVTLLNSRFLALFVAAQAGILAHYCWKPLRRRMLTAGAVVGVMVLIGFGLYRDFAAVSTVERVPLANGVQGFLEYRAPTGIVDWFYSLNVEGFAGFAGIVTADEQLPGGIRQDYGISSLSFVTHMFPNSVRTDPASPIKSVNDYLDSVYPYNGSVVPPGFELAFGGFGILGVLLLGGLLGYGMKALDRGLRLRSASGKALLFGVVSVQILQVIRGTFAGAIFFGLADAVLTGIYLLLSRKQELPPLAADASIPGAPPTPLTVDRRVAVPPAAATPAGAG